MFSILGNELANKGFFINLPESQIRLDHVNDLIKKYNITDLTRFEALKDDLHVFSCTKSHLSVFQTALEEDLDVIFVAEDDFDIEETCYYPREIKVFEEVLKLVCDDLKKVEWDVILLGCNPKEHLIKVTNNLYQVNKSTGAWSYLIKKRAYQYILENSNYRRDYIAIDDYLPLLNSRGFKTLTTIPLLINHGKGFVSTLQPNGPVNYDLWIQGNYHNFIYEQQDFKKKPTDHVKGIIGNIINRK